MHRYSRKGHKYKWEDSLPFHPRLSERGKCNNSLPSLSCIDAARKFSSKPKQTPVCLGKTRSQCVMRWEKPTLSCCHSCPPTPTAVQQKRACKGYLFSNISSTEKKEVLWEFAFSWVRHALFSHSSHQIHPLHGPFRYYTPQKCF